MDWKMDTIENFMLRTLPTVLEFLSQSVKEYTGLDIPERIIFGILADSTAIVMAVILVASWFILTAFCLTVKETVVELAEPIIATLKSPQCTGV